MKLVLTSFSQDISLTGDAGQQYVVVQDEETGAVFRLPAPEALIIRLSQILTGSYQGEPAIGEEEPSEPSRIPVPPDVETPVAENLGVLDPGEPPDETELVGEEEEEPPKEEQAPPAVKKRLVVPSKLQAVKARIAKTAAPTEDGVPDL